MRSAVLFDFDGVIADTDQFNYSAFTYAFGQQGVPFSDAIHTAYFKGRKLTDGCDAYCAAAAYPIDRAQLFRDKMSYDRYACDAIVLYDDACTLLASLARGPHALALATGARRSLLDQFFVRHALRQYFSVVVTGEDCAQGKPHPEAYTRALHALRVHPQHAVIIEDSPAGVAAARAAGVRCIAVTHTHDAAALGDADLVVHDLRDAAVGAAMNAL